MSTCDIYSDGSYLRNNPTWHAEESEWKANRILEILNANAIVPATLCEIGCGAGGILKHLSERLRPGAKLAGYEISPQAFALCSAHESANLRFHLADLLKEEDAFFDVVMAIDVFEHVEDYLGFLRTLKTKGTYKVFHIPLDLSVQTVLRSSPIMKSRAFLGHLHYFTKETALASLKDAGYEILDFFHTGYSLNLVRRLAFALHPDWAARLLGGTSLLVLAK